MPDETPLTGESVEFGVGVNRSIGIVQSENDNNSAELAEVKAENGKTAIMKAFSKNRERSFEAVFLAGTTPPAAGTVLTVGTAESAWTGLVTTANITKSNSEFTKISITAQKKDNAVLVAYA